MANQCIIYTKSGLCPIGLNNQEENMKSDDFISIKYEILTDCRSNFMDI